MAVLHLCFVSLCLWQVVHAAHSAFGSLCFVTRRGYGLGTPGVQDCASPSVSRNSNGLQHDEGAAPLMEWLFRQQGCEGEGSVEVCCSNDAWSRGLYAREDHEEGEYLFAVPLEAALVVEETETTDAERGLKFLKLRNDMGGGDGWNAYFDLLPTQQQHFDPTPDFWTDDEIAALEFPRLVEGVLGRKRRIQSLAKQEGIDFGELQFATWLVESRSLTLVKELDDDDNDGNDDEQLETTTVLIPLLDMINHSSDEPNAELRVLQSDDDDDDDGTVFYAVVAIEDIPAGTEVTISYGAGKDSSVELLQNYGFVPHTNHHDVEMLEDGGNDCFLAEGEWSTTVEEDEQRLRDSDVSRIERTILEFRIRMKRALREWKAQR